MDKTFWLVWKLHGAVPTHQHSTFEFAKQEAERLANMFPDATFVVLESIASCKKNSVQWTQHKEHDGLPF